MKVNITREHKIALEYAIALQQNIQMRNQPSSQVWHDASKELHRLIEELTGKPVKEAWGKK